MRDYFQYGKIFQQMEFQKWSVSSLNSFWFVNVINLTQGCVRMMGRNIFKSGGEKNRDL